MEIAKKSIKEHRKYRGKFEIHSKMPLQNKRHLSIAYTPGVGAVSSLVAKNPKYVWNVTAKQNMVAVVSDGSAVLGLGNIGPLGALPVMEGKAVLFKRFANIDAVPIVLATQDVDEIISAVKWIAPTFGGINLEDISAPRCFEIETRLIKELDIPVFHDDQHGTAIVVLAALFNALKVAGKNLGKIKIVISGAGAAGTAVAKLLIASGSKNILILDSQGIVAAGRKGLTLEKRELAHLTNRKNIQGDLTAALVGADVFIGVSKPGILKPEMIKTMAARPIIFALANPIPEIMPADAKKAGAYVVATGRSDFPNQINNSLVFPGFFRGLLDGRIGKVTQGMKLNAASALAGLIKKPSREKILPGAFDKRTVPAIARAVIRSLGRSRS